MKVFNLAERAAVIQPFAAKKLAKAHQVVLIEPGQEVEVFGPILSEYGLKLPYVMFGNVLVRDWSRPKYIWSEKNITGMVFLRDGVKDSYKQPFALADGLIEGFHIAFLDDRRLINV